MKTFSTLALALITGIATAQTAKTQKPMETTITEIVIYQIKAEKAKNFPAILDNVRTNVSKATGFVSYRTLRWTKEPNHFIASENTYIDIVEWETLKDTANAMKMAEKDPAFGEFFTSIEKITIMGHFNFYK